MYHLVLVKYWLTSGLQASNYRIFLKSIEHYGRRNKSFISGIPDDDSDDQLEEVIIKVLANVDVNMEAATLRLA